MTKKVSTLIISVILVFALVPTVSIARAAQVRSQIVPAEESEPVGNAVQNQMNEDNDERINDKAKTQRTVIIQIKKKTLHAIDSALRRYETVKTQVRSCNLDEAEKAGIIAKIEAQTEAMNMLRAQAEDASTADEVKNIMTQLKTQFKFSLGLMRQAVQGVYEDRLENISERINSVYDKIVSKVDALADGEEKDELSALLYEAEVAISSADDKLAAGDLEEATEDYKSARGTLHEIVVALCDCEEE